MTNPVPTMPVLLLVKAGEFKHSGKYYLLNGRWHKLYHDKPAPKGAPVAAAPNVVGHHKPVVLSPEQIEQLKYPADKAAKNAEMAAFNNKHLPKLLELAAAGNATALLGMKFGTNSHAKKQVMIANFLLGEMGSKHQVKTGQKAGEHEAVKQASASQDAAPQVTAPEWKPTLAEALALAGKSPEEKQATMQAWAEKVGGYDKLADVIQGLMNEAKTKQAASPASSAPKPKVAPAPKKQFAVGEVVHGYDIAHLPAGSVVSFDGGNGERMALIGHGNVWFDKLKGGGWQKNPLKPSQRSAFLAGDYSKEGAKVISLGHEDWMHPAQQEMAQKILKMKSDKGGSTQAYKLGSAVVIGEIGNPHSFIWVGETGDYGAGFSVADQEKLKSGDGLKLIAIGGDTAEDGPKEGDTKQGAEGTLVFKDGRWHKQEATADTADDAHATWLEKMQASGTKQIEFEGQEYFVVAEGTKYENGTTYVHLASISNGKKATNGWQPQQISTTIPTELLSPAASSSGALSIPEFVDAKSKPGAKAYYEKLAQKVIDLAAAGDVTSLEKMKADGLKPNSKGKVSNTWAGKTQNSKTLLELHEQALGLINSFGGSSPAPVATSGDAAHKMLDQIPWDGLKLPDSNTNAKTFNKKLAAIKEAAYAGDLAALEAMQFGKNTYNIKAAKVAATAIAALKESGQSVAAPATTSQVDDGPKEGDTKPGADGMLVFKNGRWHKVDKENPKAAPVTAAPLGVETIDSWKKTGGQEGYNEGGFFTDDTGQQWYCKFSSGGEEVARTEILALKLYEAAGANVPEMKLVKLGGKIGTASKIIPDLKKNKAALQSGSAHAIFDSFAADAWLANWDVVGNNPAAGKGFDNIQFTSDGKAYRIDAGGALHFKGTGAKKSSAEWSDSVIELKTLLDPTINPNTAKAFSKISQADITASVAKVAAIPDETIADLVNQLGYGSAAEKKALIDKLIARKHSLVSQYPKALKKTAAANKPADPSDMSWVKLKPGEKVVETGEKFGIQFAKIEVPAKGFHADGIPKPYVYNKSSSKFVNEQNTADIQSIYDTAISTKSAEAVKNLKFDEIVKATGEKTGKKLRIDEHPSKAWVKEYLTQVAAELEAQLNPTYRIEHNGSLSSGYSKAAAEIAARAKAVGYEQFKNWKKKAADYLVLSSGAGDGIPTPEPGQFRNVELNDPEMQKLKKASDSSFEKLSPSEKSACKAYTGSAYAKWNEALRTGDLDSTYFTEAQKMVKAFDKAAVELPEGIILHRGINVGGETYESVVGAVIQDGSFQSSSYGEKAAFSGQQSQLRLHITRGVKGLMAISFSNYGKHEREIILHPNCRFVVMKVQKGGYQNIVDVLVLPHED